MSAPAAKFEGGQIWWRGSNPGWVYLPRDDAGRRRAQFDAVTDYFRPIAQVFVRDLDAAIAQFDQEQGATQ